MKSKPINLFFIVPALFLLSITPRLGFTREINGTTQTFHAHKIIQTLSHSYYKRFQKQVAFYNLVFPSNQELANYIDRSKLNKSNSYYIRKLFKQMPTRHFKRMKIIQGSATVEIMNTQFKMSASDFFKKQFWIGKQLIKAPKNNSMKDLEKIVRKTLMKKEKFSSLSLFIKSAHADGTVVSNIVLTASGMLYIYPPEYNCNDGDAGRSAWLSFTRDIVRRLNDNLDSSIKKCMTNGMPFDKDRERLSKIADDLNHNRQVNEGNLISVILGKNGVNQSFYESYKRFGFSGAFGMAVKETVDNCGGDPDDPEEMKSSLAHAIAGTHDDHIFTSSGRCYSAGTAKQIKDKTSPYWKFIKKFNSEVCSKLDELRDCIENHVIICDYRKLKYNLKTKKSYYYDEAISGRPEGVCWRGDHYINQGRIKNKLQWVEIGPARKKGSAVKPMTGEEK